MPALNPRHVRMAGRREAAPQEHPLTRTSGPQEKSIDFYLDWVQNGSMHYYGFALTQPESPRTPAIYFAGYGDDGEVRWTPNLLHGRSYHTRRLALALLDRLREWAATHYSVPVVVELVGTYADRHGIASDRARAEWEHGRSASMVEAERIEAARKAERRSHLEKVAADSRVHGGKPCVVCGKPLDPERRRGKPSPACAGACREAHKAAAKARQKEYNAEYFKANRSRILAVREERLARESEREVAK